jgi:hypothetical protein
MMTWHERKGSLLLLFLHSPISTFIFSIQCGRKRFSDFLFFFLDGCHRESLESRSLGAAAAAAQMEDIHWHRRKKVKKKFQKKFFFLERSPQMGDDAFLSSSVALCVTWHWLCSSTAHRSWVCPPLRPSLLVPLDFWLNRAVLSPR